MQTQAAKKLWPDIFTSADAQARKDKILEDMRAVRPVVETGYVAASFPLSIQGIALQHMANNHSTVFIILLMQI